MIGLSLFMFKYWSSEPGVWGVHEKPGFPVLAKLVQAVVIVYLTASSASFKSPLPLREKVKQLIEVHAFLLEYLLYTILICHKAK